MTPRLYGHYAWRVHVTDPFGCFDGALKARLLTLNPRTAEPRGGKIDYDALDVFSRWYGDACVVF